MSRHVTSWLIRLLLLQKTLDLLAKIWPVNHLFSSFERFSIWWQTIPKFRRHVVTNIFVGIAIAIVLHIFHGSSWLREAENSGIDWMIRMNQGAVESTKASYAFLDIDEKTYRYLGEPFYTPRDALLKVIDYATSSKPRMVFLDIELALSGHDQPADLAIEKFLVNYPEHASPLILVRTFRAKLDNSGVIEQRRSFLDDIVSRKTNIFWASTLFLRDKDYSVRRWQLWTKAENHLSDLEIIPSIQLLATSIILQPFLQPQVVNKKIVDKLTPYASGKKISSDSLNLAGLTVSVNPTPLQQRIIYSFPAQANRMGSLQMVKKVGGQEPIFMRRSAFPIIASKQPVDNLWLEGRVVVIGASYADSRDIHSTPLGEMPGAMILLNAIQSLMQNGEISPPATWVKFLVEIVLISVMSFAFALMSSFWGMLISGAFVVAVLLPLSFIFFKHGVWFDFVIPLVGVQLHEMAAKFEEKFKNNNSSRVPAGEQ